MTALSLAELHFCCCALLIDFFPKLHNSFASFLYILISITHRCITIHDRKVRLTRFSTFVLHANPLSSRAGEINIDAQIPYLASSIGACGNSLAGGE